jgi:murein DD-endopeptidase MepM/ murein hydrolase activator NlpD
MVVVGLLAWPLASELIRDWPAWLAPGSPRDRYLQELRAAGLQQTDAGQAWLAAATEALAAPDEAPPAFARSDAFDTDRAAHAWRFSVRRGRRLTIDIAYGRGGLFVDLFAADGLERLASAAGGSTSLAYDVKVDTDVIALLQPALSLGGGYRLVQRADATLRFPVPGVTPRQVHSLFGDPRDTGGRRHEGIDIFAPRGTPVVAAADGWITPRTSNNLGGNVVWIWSLNPRVALYYAHLDRQAVSPGARVRAGEVVGYVGNTGNARGTSPHLHFGVYAPPAGAVDPLPYVCDAPCGERVMH